MSGFNLRSLDLNLLAVFEAICEAGSVSAAAERLALSQSATSHALARLREACGDELFVRTARGLAPTPVAQGMYPAVREALETLRATLSEARGFDPARARRRFRITIPHPMGPFHALALRAAAASRAPLVSLGFDTMSLPPLLEEELRDGVVDLAVDWLTIDLDPFVNTRLFDDRLVVIARRDHPVLRPGLTVADLQQVEFVLPHARRDERHRPPAVREIARLGLRGAVWVSELLEIPTVVSSTDLAGLFLASMAPLLQQRMGLQVLPVPLPLPPMPIYMVWHESRRRDAAHRWLRGLVREELAGFEYGRREDPPAAHADVETLSGLTGPADR